MCVRIQVKQITRERDDLKNIEKLQTLISLGRAAKVIETSPNIILTSQGWFVDTPW